MRPVSAWRYGEVIGLEGGRDVRRRYFNGVLVEVHYLVGGKWMSPLDLLRRRLGRETT